MKTTYHTDLLFRFRLGLLAPEMTGRIPHSTLSGWKSRDLSRIVGCEHAITEDNLAMMREFLGRKRLLAAAKSLWHLYHTLLAITSSLRDFHKTLRKHRQQVTVAITRSASAIGTERACRMLGITAHQYRSWKGRVPCRSSALHLCRRKQPQQLTAPETRVIREYLLKPALLSWPLSSVYHQMIRDGAAAMGLGTFYKYAEVLGIQRSKLRRRDLKWYSPLRADGPLKILHMDVTVLRTADNIKCYIYIVQCNFSRAILTIRASLHCNAQTAMENLRHAIQNQNLWNLPLQLITDDGSENKGAVLDFLLREDVDIQKIIAQVDIRSSNSMIEAVNKRLKYDFLYRLKPPDFKSLVEMLPQIQEQYNNKPLNALHGLTPAEVLQGQMPDKTKLKALIAKARQGRRAVNQKSDCSIC